MRCDEARQALSVAFDGEPTGGAAPVEAEAHRTGCDACTRYGNDLDRIRGHLRTTPANAPDVTAAVMARVRRDERSPTPIVTAPRAAKRRHHLPAAAVFVAAALAAAVFVHTSSGPGGVAAADLAERVVAAQHDVRGLSARVDIIERGWNPAVPERRFDGRLRYQAPESLSLTLHDRTVYPDPTWPANDVALRVDQDTWTVSGLRDCPSGAQPTCTPTGHDIRSVVHREPFSEAAPAPLELVMPVQSFALAGTPATLPDGAVGGRDTVGIRTTAAQVEPLLSGLRPAGNLRLVHPTDPVDLRLDRRTLVPLQVVVRAARGPDRRAWAEANGYSDRAGATVLEVTLADVTVNGHPTLDEMPASPGAAAVTDGAFGDAAVDDADVPAPGHLPAGLRPYRSGVVDTTLGPAVAIRTWTDGRAWLAVSATTQWPGDRLMGDLGTIVRSVDLGAGGRGYLSEDGRRIGIHAAGLDVVVAGSVSRAELEAAASSLGVVGRAVPASWDEAATANVASAKRSLQPLLLPVGLDGFGPPALRIDGVSVSASFAGPGDRAFALVQSPATKLSPPLDATDLVAVTVRGVPGRYSPERGELEWFEVGHLYRLRSPSLGRDELVRIAESLEPS